jgi:two-component system, LytTR family, response regulator
MRAIIIDDEKKARQLLRVVLSENCPHVQLVDDCEDLPSGVKSIKKNQPDLVFLDIEMPGFSGLQLLDFFNEDEINFDIIFVTAYNEYAIQAFKLSAVDYILKPINTEVLIESIARFEKQNEKFNKKLSLLKHNLENTEDRKIAIPSRESVSYVLPRDIMYVKADGAYTMFHLKNGQKHMLSRNLKYVEDMLESNTFLKRCHKSYIINTQLIIGFSRQDYMADLGAGIKIPISTDKMNEVLL